MLCEGPRRTVWSWVCGKLIIRQTKDIEEVREEVWRAVHSVRSPAMAQHKGCNSSKYWSSGADSAVHHHLKMHTANHHVPRSIMVHHIGITLKICNQRSSRKRREENHDWSRFATFRPCLSTMMMPRLNKGTASFIKRPTKASCQSSPDTSQSKFTPSSS
jgi:hypothetical protein